jgi:hypothetical protein
MLILVGSWGASKGAKTAQMTRIDMMIMGIHGK